MKRKNERLIKKINTLRIGCAQHIGSRESQEDSFAFSDLEDCELLLDCGFISVVADGMGGLAYGKEASETAALVMTQVYTNKTRSEPVHTALIRSLCAANEKVVRMAEENRAYGNAGTTLVAAVLIDDRFFYVSVGDSRIYFYRDSVLEILNVPHNYGNTLRQKMINGEISKSQVDENSQKEHLTSFLGLDEVPEIDYNQIPINLKRGDTVLLCSDGLFNTLDDREISSILKEKAKHPQSAADALVSMAAGKGMPYQDNVTVAVVEYC